MFRPDLTCKISRMGDTDIYAKRTYGAWITVMCGVVKLTESSKKTSVRTDASASRGSAQEILADARLLFPASVVLKPGDRISVHGIELTVVSIFPRHRVTGQFDHWQVDCDIYGSG